MPLFGLVVLGFGILLVAGMVLQIRRAASARSWPSVDGVITRSEAEHVVERDSDGTSESWHFRVAYEYVVEGRKHVGIIFSTSAMEVNTKGWVHRKVAKYPVGSSVTVFYNPERPSDSAIDRSIGLGSILGYLFILALGLICFAVGVALLIPGSQPPGSG